MVVFRQTKAVADFGSPLGNRAALFRKALLASMHEEGARKGAPNIACLTLSWPADRGWRESHESGRKTRNMKKPKSNSLILGAWNVRTLLDNPRANRPERRTALIARELHRYKLDIVALSETRFAGEGHLKEDKGNYTFFWSGRSSEERRESGVGFAIRNSIVSHLTSLPTGLSDRLMTLRIPIGNNIYATLISAYAPTLTNPDAAKDQFYQELDAVISHTSKKDKLIILGDFNARVGIDHHTWQNVIGKNGVGKCNSNGLLLLRTCTSHDLLITNTVFRQANRYKTTWMHPRSKHWHMIDYVIVRLADRQDVKITRALPLAECWTDHRLVISKVTFSIRAKRRPQGKKVPKRIDVSKLSVPGKVNQLNSRLNDKLNTLEFGRSNPDEDWSSFRDTVHSISYEILGPTEKRHQDWFDDNDVIIQDLLATKHKLLAAHQQDPNSVSKKAAFTNIRRIVQAKLRDMQDSWLSRKADEIQTHADKHDTKRFYDALKDVYGPQSSGTSPIFNSDGKTLLTDHSDILNRWAEHFESVLNRPSEINEEAIARLPQVDMNNDMDNIPLISEVEKAISQLSCGKAPGSDSIPAEIYKAGGSTLTEKLQELFSSFWDKGILPQEFKDASIVHLYKRKGNRQCCDNHRGISLLCIAGKVLARVLLNRLINHLEDGLLPESQCGFRAGRGTVDMIFAARQLQEKCQEQYQDLYTTFVDLTKAFDTVSREGLWKIMAKFGCPAKFIAIVRQFHDGMMARVMDGGEASPDFAVTNGVKQGCVLAPTLFSMMFSAMLSDAFNDDDPGIQIRYRTDGKLFNQSRLNAVTKVKSTIIRDLLFADDCALNASTESEMQHNMDKFSAACDNFGLTISTKKTEVLHQPAPGKLYTKPTIKIKDQILQAVDKFTYLGSTLSREVHIDDEINSRIAKASAAFGRLRSNVWERKGIKLLTKIKVYRAVVMTTLLYACESWTIYSRHAKALNHFHMTCLRRLMNIKWQDRIPDTEVLVRANLPSIFTLLQKAQVRWAGHVHRMSDMRLPKLLLYGELVHGKRRAGGQRKRFKDCLKASLKSLNINHDSWESLAVDSNSWRSTINNAAQDAEKLRIEDQRSRRFTRKARLASLPSTVTNSNHKCPTCGRCFRAQIGLISHMRTHRTQSNQH